MISATGIMAVITYVCFTMFPLKASDQSFFASFPRFFILVFVCLSAYVIISWMFKLKEAKPIITRAVNLLFGGVGRV